MRGRAVLLELLAGAGTPEAQVAMVKALNTRQARGDKQYHMLLGRLALVQLRDEVLTGKLDPQSYGSLVT